MNRTLSIIALTALAAGSVTYLSSHQTVRAASTPETEAGAVQEITRLAGGGGPAAFWWTELFSQSALSVWIGPVLLNESGLPIRMWTLSCHMPGTDEPLSCLQGGVLLSSRDEIMLRSSNFMIQLEPKEGLAWSDVRAVEDLQTSVDGLF